MYTVHQSNRSPRQTIQTAISIKDDDFDFLGDPDQPQQFLYWEVGTSGLLSPNYLHASAATSNWNINQISEAHEQSENFIDTIRNSAQDVAHIRAVAKISISELSRVFGVSRQAVHEWIKGATLSHQNAQRLSALAQAIDVFLEFGVEITPQTFRRKVAGGPSIFEAAKEDKNVIELAKTLVVTLVRESQQRKLLAARLAGRSTPSASDIEFGTPHLKEDL